MVTTKAFSRLGVASGDDHCRRAKVGDRLFQVEMLTTAAGDAPEEGQGGNSARRTPTASVGLNFNHVVLRDGLPSEGVYFSPDWRL